MTVRVFTLQRISVGYRCYYGVGVMRGPNNIEIDVCFIDWKCSQCWVVNSRNWRDMPWNEKFDGNVGRAEAAKTGWGTSGSSGPSAAASSPWGTAACTCHGRHARTRSCVTWEVSKSSHTWASRWTAKRTKVGVSDAKVRASYASGWTGPGLRIGMFRMEKRCADMTRGSINLNPHEINLNTLENILNTREINLNTHEN